MIYRITFLILMMIGLADGQTQEAGITRIVTRVSEGILTGDVPVLSEDVERRVQVMVRELEADASVVAFERQVVTEARRAEETKRTQVMDNILSNVMKGVLVILILLVVAAVIRKIGSISRKDKQGSLISVNDTLRSAPCVVTFAMNSEMEAVGVGRSLVDARLAARVDVLHQRALGAAQDGSLLLVQTVKGRLKALKKVLDEQASDASVFSIPALKGHADYLNWIADAADGRG